MRPKYVIISLVAIFAILQSSCDQSHKRIQNRQEVLIRHRHHDSGEHEIWIHAANNTNDTKLLYRYYRHAESLVSPDSQWIAINNFLGSDSSETILFFKENGLNYDRLEINLKDQVWKQYCYTHLIDESPGFDHFYIEAVRWLNGRKLVLQLYGYDSGSKRILEPYDIIFNLPPTEKGEGAKKGSK